MRAMVSYKRTFIIQSLRSNRLVASKKFDESDQAGIGRIIGPYELHTAGMPFGILVAL